MNIFAHATYVGPTGYNSHCQNFFKKLSKYCNLKIRNFTVGRNWKGYSVGDPHGDDVDDVDKSILGLQSLWNPKNELEDFPLYNFDINTFNYDLNLILAEVDHYYFYHKYKGPKIAYTVWETTLYPEPFFSKLKEFDQVWVPTEWQAQITINQGIDRDKVKVIPEGVDQNCFYPRSDLKPRDKFTFLIFGRWDARKSTREMIQAFKNVFGNADGVELLISVDNPYSVDGLSSTEERLDKYNLSCNNIKVLHFPSKEEYIKLLNTSHVFISCSRSEGWNLPLIEAMACGMPSIYSNCSGQLEFAKNYGVPIKILREISPSDADGSFSKITNFFSGNWYEPDFKDLESKLLYCYENYLSLKKQALVDSEKIRNDFNWDNAAKKAMVVLNDFMNKDENLDYEIIYGGTTEDDLGIFYKSSISSPRKILIEIIDKFTGFLFHLEEIEISNQCFWVTKHAYRLPNQVFIIRDALTKEIKFQTEINQNKNLDTSWFKAENLNLISKIPDEIIKECYLKKDNSLGVNFLEIFYRNTYNFKSCKIEKGDVVFDLGSCFGLFSRYAFQQGASEVHSFEPNKDLEICNRNLNDFQNYYFNSRAVHSKNVGFNKTDFLMGNFVEETFSGSNLSININDYIKTYKINRIDYLKIDIEGSEYDFFETLDENFLRNKVKKIALEFHFNTDSRVEKIVNKLKVCGFDFEFEFPEVRNQHLGMLYAWKKTNFDFESFFGKYRKYIEQSGRSRLKFYEYIIPKLASLNKPIHVLETGTMWGGLDINMGAFTLIMADLIKNHTGGRIFTVDISEGSINKCKNHTLGFHDVIEFVTSDSVTYLKNLPDEFVYNLDLVYLDSYDYHFPNPKPSAQHHLNELCAVYDRLNDRCGIAVDDNFLPNCWVEWNFYNPDGSICGKQIFNVENYPQGKGEYCHPKLIGKGWRRFSEFDDFPNNNLFYYERSKLSVEQVDKLLGDFYSKHKVEKPKTDKFLSCSHIQNKATGLGDALILNNLSHAKFISSGFSGFNELMKFNDRYKTDLQGNFFDIDTSDYVNYDWGGGHCTQRLEKAFLGYSSDIPKPYISKSYNPIKNKVCVHLQGKTCALDNVFQTKLINWIKKLGYTVVVWNDKDLSSGIDEISTCEFFVGVASGPMHVAAALGIKSIIILIDDYCNLIYLPKLTEANLLGSEWLYPQNVHLSTVTDNELIETLTFANLERAFNGKLYPYFSHDFILKKKLKVDFNFKVDENKLEFVFDQSISNAEIVLRELNTNLKCYSWIAQKFEKNVLHYIIPTSSKKLIDLDFTGFIFSVYQNNILIHEEVLHLNKKQNYKLKFCFDDYCKSNCKDDFYLQHVDFANNELLEKIIKDSSIIVDVGASCGTFAYRCLQKQIDKIFCLEPSTSFYILEKTFKNEPRVTPLNLALSTLDGEKNIYFPSYSTLSSFHIDEQLKYDSAKLINETNTVAVKCITLKSLIKNHSLNRIDLFKLDIEGHEYEIFKLIDEDDLKIIKSFLIEFHHNSDNRLNIILDKLKLSGFEIKLLKLNYKDNYDPSELQGVVYAFKNEIDIESQSEIDSQDSYAVVNESPSLGDVISWVPMVDKFQKQKNKTVNFYTPYYEIFQSVYPNINFFPYENKPTNNRNLTRLGTFNVGGKKWNQYNQQELAAELLGITYEEVKCKISLPKNLKNNFSKKYVCIATQSTAQLKYWNNSNGWNLTVSYLKNLGYEVVCIDRYNSYGVEDKMNFIPVGCIDKTGDLSLEERINDLYFCDFFIGLASGLSWLAWACNKPVVMISGFSDPKTEFFTEYRVHNKNVCNSCWNDNSIEIKIDNWKWCPRNKNFECSEKISFEMVKEKIDLCIKNINLNASVGEKMNNQTTLINFLSESLGDNIAYSPYPDLYQKKHGGKVLVSSKWSNIFESKNPNVKFIQKNESVYFDNKIDIFYKPGSIPMQKSICDDLGLQNQEILPPLITNLKHSFNKKKKYVCISVHSTAQLKYWNNSVGWRKTVSYLKDLGYDVYCIDKYYSFGTNKFMNEIPNNVIDETGDKPIEYRMAQIKNCEFFIGLTSGLSWLAWGMGKKVILISGVSFPEKEFFTPYRVINRDVCHACCCKQDFLISDQPWDFCPENKNFECTRKISFEMVKEKIDQCIKDLKNTSDSSLQNFNWNSTDNWYKTVIKQEIFDDKIYERVFEVEFNDVVVDFGASVGLFAKSILAKKPKHVYSLEPSQALYADLLKNLNGSIFTNLNCGVFDRDVEISSSEMQLFYPSENQKNVYGITFKSFINLFNITKIDFLKTDCEGGEYYIFAEENYDWICKNVGKIAGEWHLSTKEEKNKFRKFRDTYLSRSNFWVYSVDGVDIKWDIWNEHFIEYYQQVIIYIKNF